MDLLRDLEKNTAGGPRSGKGQTGVNSLLRNFQRELGDTDTGRRVSILLGKPWRSEAVGIVS